MKKQYCECRECSSRWSAIRGQVCMECDLEEEEENTPEIDFVEDEIKNEYKEDAEEDGSNY